MAHKQRFIHHLSVSLVPNLGTLQSPQSDLTPWTLTLNKGVDLCTGDGGGPLVCPKISNPDQYVQVSRYLLRCLDYSFLMKKFLQFRQILVAFSEYVDFKNLLPYNSSNRKKKT